MEADFNSLKELCKSRDESGVVALIERYPQLLNQQDESGSTGFLLIAYSFLPNAFAKAKKLKTNTSFHEAVVGGDLERVRENVTRDGSLVNAISPDGFSPLSLAAFFDQVEIAKFLLFRGASPDLPATNPSKVTALHSAVARQNYELCVLFIEAGADVNAVQMQNVSALHSAAHKGNLALVKLLVENGARLTHAMDNGDTALSIARREGTSEVEEYLNGVLESQ